MRKLVGIALAASLLVGPGALVSREAAARSCFSIWAEADGAGSSFRHFVYVENDCEDWLECTVWTDVNPQPPKILSVAPGATEHAETNSHSQYDDPRAFGSCRLK